MTTIPDKLDTRKHDLRVAWDAVKDAHVTVERAMRANNLTSEMASKLAKATRNYIAVLDKLVLRD